MIKAQVAGVKDFVGIADVELKSYEYALQHDTITSMFDAPRSITGVVRFNHRVIAWGHAFMSTDSNLLQLTRLATHPTFRRTRNATRILALLWDEAAKWNPSGIETVVPEYQMLMEDPYSVNEFAWKAGFKATGLKKDVYRQYGRPYDGIILTRDIE